MMPLIIWIIIFIVSLAVLVKSAEEFTDSAEKIGLFFGLPQFIIGVTIVAVGTSLPELVSSIVAVLNNSSEIVAGNVVGSNITNIFLILGIAAVAGKKIRITHELIRVDLPLLVGSALLLTVTVWDGIYTIPEALLCLAGLAVYLLYTISSETGNGHLEIKEKIKASKRKEFDWAALAILVTSAFFIYLGAKYTVDSVIRLSEILDMGKEIIAISAVALGTSLPELTVSFSAARNGKAEISVGNLLGSNIFNSFAVMAVPAFFGALTIPQNIISFGIPMMLTATVLCFFMIQDKEITRWEGYLLIIFYIFFIGKLFALI